MKIYTKTGDDGTTGVFGGGRVLKADPRIEALGAIDELNASVGMARSLAVQSEIDSWLERIQRELFDLGAEIACPIENRHFKAAIRNEHIERLEQEIDLIELPPLREFILPGGTALASSLHLARTVARRAERVLIGASQSIELRQEPSQYLNRLSDWMFVMARSANHSAGVPDVKWKEAE